MPRTIHEQGQAIDFSSRGDTTRQLFQDLLFGSLDSQNFANNEFVNPSFANLSSMIPGLSAALPGITLPDFTSEGLSPATLAAMRGRALEDIPRNFDAAGGSLRKELSRRGLFGGQTPASGLAANPLIALEVQKLLARSNALRDVDLANEEALFRNRSQLSVPARQQSLQAQLGQNQGTLATRGLGLQGATDLLGGGLNIANLFGNRLPTLTSGLLGGLNAFGQGTNIRGQLGAQDTSFWDSFAQSLLGPAIGAGLSMIPGLGGAAGGLGGGGLNSRTGGILSGFGLA